MSDIADHRRGSPRSTPSSSLASSSFFTLPVTDTFSSLSRRLSDWVSHSSGPSSPDVSELAPTSHPLAQSTNGQDGVYTPPVRRPSPFQPPPLSPLNLQFQDTTINAARRILSRALAEEIRLLVPSRLQLVDSWSLAYSLDRDGVSLATLYKRCDEYRGKRGSFVLVVKDTGSNVFGAYLTDPPHPQKHFFGTGECFLWRSKTLSGLATLASLPPPPSADTTHLQRATTVGQAKAASGIALTPPTSGAVSGTSTPEQIRFKAFPYSGENDYLIYCEHGYLSIGGGDGHYGLWLDDNLDKGVSETCPTFGNEPLSDDGKKFEIMGVEIWYIGV